MPNQNLDISHLSNISFLKALYEYGGIPTDVIENKELMDLFLPGLKADFTINENYSYNSNKVINNPITGF